MITSEICVTVKCDKWKHSQLCDSVYSLASLINLLSVFRRGRCVCACQNRKKEHGFSLTNKSSFLSSDLYHSLSDTETVFLFVPECAYEFMEAPHAWGAAPPSASDGSWSPAIRHEPSILCSNISEPPAAFFPKCSAYLDQVGWWTRQSKSFPALMSLTQPLGSHPYPNYWKRNVCSMKQKIFCC